MSTKKITIEIDASLIKKQNKPVKVKTDFQKRKKFIMVEYAPNGTQTATHYGMTELEAAELLRDGSHFGHKFVPFKSDKKYMTTDIPIVRK